MNNTICNGQKTKWWHTAPVYEVYVQTFNDSNGDGIGDLNGVTEKLPYLKALGVGCIWLSPIFETPYFDCGYDSSDFMNINPDFGTKEDLRVLLDTAHSMGIKVIIDLVLTYTSNKHRWFIEACKSKESKYHDYYIFAPGKGGKEPNNKTCFISSGSSWEYNEPTDDYYFHFWPKEQVHLNWENPAVKKEMLDIAKYWLEFGVDGYRLDAINALLPVKDLSGNPTDADGKVIFRRPSYWQIHQCLQELREIVNEFDDRMLLGEVFPGGTEQALEFYGQHNELHLVFNFTYLHTIKSYCGDNFDWSTLFDTAHYDAEADSLATKLRNMMQLDDSVCRNYENWSTVVLGNHDQPRIASILKGLCNDSANEEHMVKWGAVYTFGLKGTPFIYNGEEIGMESWQVPSLDFYKDQHGVVYYNVCKDRGMSDEESFKIAGMVGRDHCRTPMQWSDGENAGFSTADTTWLPMSPQSKTCTVQEQEARENSNLSFYRKASKLHANSEALSMGDYEWIDNNSDKYLAFIRRSGQEMALVILNCCEETVKFSYEQPKGMMIDKTLSTRGTSPLESGKLQPFEACLITFKNN